MAEIKLTLRAKLLYDMDGIKDHLLLDIDTQNPSHYKNESVLLHVIHTYLESEHNFNLIHYLKLNSEILDLQNNQDKP
jgi:hypothetical protein